MRRILKDIKYYLWGLNGLIGLKCRLDMSQKATVLIAYFNPIRMRHINHQLRNILKCEFVGKIIISNHNPHVQINQLIKVNDERIVIVHQDTRRGCGHRWLVAHDFSPEYLIVVDDDVLIFPWQLRQLFKVLVAEPEIPHGFAGMTLNTNKELTYYERDEREVDFIGEVYAITGEQLKKYFVLRNGFFAENNILSNNVENFADFILISKSGTQKPKIHNAGRLFRCSTYDTAGIALHKEHEFRKSVAAIIEAMDH